MSLPKCGVVLDAIKFWEVHILGYHQAHHYNNPLLSQTNQLTFPTLYHMAMDYLPIQASSVLCERVFFLSSETDTKKQNRIKPELFEALQILNFGL
jgi:hypothetical protein